MKTIPLSVVCSLVCDHEKQCEGHCILGVKGAPVHISSIENYISDTYLDRLSWSPEPRKGQKVGIIGSAPAGITIAVILQQRGYDVTIFESKEKIGGVLRYWHTCLQAPQGDTGPLQGPNEEAGHKDQAEHCHRPFADGG